MKYSKAARDPKVRTWMCRLFEVGDSGVEEPCKGSVLYLLNPKPQTTLRPCLQFWVSAVSVSRAGKVVQTLRGTSFAD